MPLSVGVDGERRRRVLKALAALPCVALDGSAGIILALRWLSHRHALDHGLSAKKTLLALVDHVEEDGLKASFSAPYLARQMSDLGF